MTGFVRLPRVCAALLSALFAISPVIGLAEETTTKPIELGPDPNALGWLACTVVIAVALFLGVLLKDYIPWLKGESSVTYQQAEMKIFAATQKIGQVVLLFGIGGVIAMAFFSAGLANLRGAFFGYFGTDMLLAAAASGAGAVLGFIFGIPRSTLQTTQIVSGQDGGGQDKAVRAALAANTNLERVSDWLTTLLVGATLVQLGPILLWVETLAHSIATEQVTNGTIVPFILAYFAALSFLGIYMITRLYLTTALAQTLSQLEGVAADPKVSDITLQLESAERSLPSLETADLKKQRLEQVLGEFDQAPLSEEQRQNAPLSLALARVLALYLKGGNVDRPTERRMQFETAVRLAAKRGDLRDVLKKDLGKATNLTTDKPADDEALGKTLV